MKLGILTLLLLVSTVLSAQTQKGFYVAKQQEKKAEGKTYALIVGISKYKDTSIPALEYADKDAEVFYNYLLSAGVDSNNITLRLNESAKSGTLWMDILNLTETSLKGDKVYIYFSGHGDVESKTLMHDAYLLTYDTPKNMYVATSIPVYQFQNYLATLSAKGVEVVFICDACHSGNLSGGREGMLAAATVLNGVWKDEIKILSCQPGELSIEGKQWGNGRGLFSYELINGIAGLADRNKDGRVSLKELNLFLMEKVSDEAAPAIQNPVVNGNMETEVAKVNEPYLKTITTSTSIPVFARVDSKGMEESLLRNQPDTIKRIYSQFTYLMDKEILALSDFEYRNLSDGFEFKKDRAAYDLVNLIPNNDSTILLKGMMKINLAAEMINEVNNNIDQVVDNRTGFNYGSPFWGGIYYSSQLIDLLGLHRIKELGLEPKLIYLEVLRLKNNPGKDNNDYFISLLDSALTLDSKASYLHALKSDILRDLKKNEESRDEAIRAIEISPKFAYPYRLLAGAYNDLKKPDSAIVISYRLLNLDTFYAPAVYRHLIRSYFVLNRSDSVDFYLNKYFCTNNYKKDTNNLFQANDLLADFCFDNKKYSESIHYHQLLIDIMESKHDTVYIVRHSESHEGLKNSTAAAHHIYDEYYNIACIFSLANENDNALKYLELSIQKGYNEFESIIKDDLDLDNIRSSPAFIALMKKYFPDQYKEK